MGNWLYIPIYVHHGTYLALATGKILQDTVFGETYQLTLTMGSVTLKFHFSENIRLAKQSLTLQVCN